MFLPEWEQAQEERTLPLPPWLLSLAEPSCSCSGNPLQTTPSNHNTPSSFHSADRLQSHSSWTQKKTTAGGFTDLHLLPGWQETLWGIRHRGRTCLLPPLLPLFSDGAGRSDSGALSLHPPISWEQWDQWGPWQPLLLRMERKRGDIVTGGTADRILPDLGI